MPERPEGAEGERSADRPHVLQEPWERKATPPELFAEPEGRKPEEDRADRRQWRQKINLPDQAQVRPVAARDPLEHRRSYYYNESCQSVLPGRALGLDRWGNGTGARTHTRVPIGNPGFGAAVMPGACRRVTALRGGNLVEDILTPTRRQRQQDAEQQADLLQAQHQGCC